MKKKIKQFKIGDEVVLNYFSSSHKSPIRGKIVFIDKKGTFNHMPFLVSLDSRDLKHLNEFTPNCWGTLKKDWEVYETKTKFPENLDKSKYYQWFDDEDVIGIADEVKFDLLINSINEELNE